MELMNLRQVRDLLGFKSYKPVRKLIELGLPVIHLGKGRYIAKDDLDEFLKAHTVVKKEG